MREDNQSDSRTRKDSRAIVRMAGNHPKPKSNPLWGSNFVKGFTLENKSKHHRNPITNKNAAPPHPSSANAPSCHGEPSPQQHSRVKRSLMAEFPCASAANGAQVHPRVFDCQRVVSPSSRDLLSEIDNLRSLLRDSKDRELALRAELLEHEDNSRVSELEVVLQEKKAEIANLNRRIGALEAEKTSLSEQLASSPIEQPDFFNCAASNRGKDSAMAVNNGIAFEVLQLRRLNKDLQLQKRNLALRLSSTESKLAALTKIAESDIVAKVKEEASELRHANESLSKQVEGLQMSRLTEVEELAYLRWVNSCMRQELSNSRQDVDSDDGSGRSCVDYEPADGSVDQRCSPYKSPSVGLDGFVVIDEETTTSSSSSSGSDSQPFDCEVVADENCLEEALEGGSFRRRHSIGFPKSCVEVFTPNKRRQSVAFPFPSVLDEGVPVHGYGHGIKGTRLALVQKYDMGAAARSPRSCSRKQGSCKASDLDVERRTLRVPNPPPKPSNLVSDIAKTSGLVPLPPPPPPPLPPPPPPNFSSRFAGAMQRAPQVAELYHSLMKRDSRRDASGGGAGDPLNVDNVRSSMIGEIENRSSHLLAIKADVETQGEFVRSLIKEVNNAAYHDIGDVVAFVKWLDDELCFLVDERAVLKHFDWPEKKADALREAAFGYRDLKKLESEVSGYEDDPRLPCDVALKKLVALSEKMERSVYNLLRTREVAIRHCKEFHIPTNWMLDSGIINKIKFASAGLAKKYMRRVAAELQAMGGALDKDPTLEYMLLQGVRFAFRIHQFAGGFDSESMRAFEELRDLAHVRKKA